MKTIKVILLVLSIVMFMSFTTSVKDQVANDLKMMSNYFVENSNIKLKVDYYVFKGFNADVPESHIAGYYTRFDSLSIMSLNGEITYLSSKYQISVNKKNRTIVLNNGVNSNDLLPDFDKTKEYLNAANKVEFIQSGSSKVRGVSIKFNEGTNQYDKIELHYNKDSYLTQRIVFYQSNASNMGSDWIGKKLRAEVKYTKIKLDAFNKSDFELENYVKIIDGNIYGIGKYSNYKIIDVRIQN